MEASEGSRPKHSEDLTAPVTASFMFKLFANADRSGALVGVNLNGVGVASDNVEVGGAGNYREYAMGSSRTPVTRFGCGSIHRPCPVWP